MKRFLIGCLFVLLMSMSVRASESERVDSDTGGESFGLNLYINLENYTIKSIDERQDIKISLLGQDLSGNEIGVELTPKVVRSESMLYTYERLPLGYYNKIEYTIKGEKGEVNSNSDEESEWVVTSGVGSFSIFKDQEYELLIKFRKPGGSIFIDTNNIGSISDGSVFLQGRDLSGECIFRFMNKKSFLNVPLGKYEIYARDENGNLFFSKNVELLNDRDIVNVVLQYFMEV